MSSSNIITAVPFTRVDFQLVVQKLRREFTHAQNFLFKIPAQVRACADSRRDFWTTNWKSTVCYRDKGDSGGHSLSPPSKASSIPLTGDPRADADILAFYKARQKLITEFK